jgi:hypothetical protein
VFVVDCGVGEESRVDGHYSGFNAPALCVYRSGEVCLRVVVFSGKPKLLLVVIVSEILGIVDVLKLG